MAHLQNEIAPEKYLIRYEKRSENREKKIRKTIRNVSENVKTPFLLPKNISPGLLKNVPPPENCTKLRFFHRDDMQGWPR